MANTRMQKKSVASGADVVVEEAPVESGSFDVTVTKVYGRRRNGGKSEKEKSVEVVLPSPKKEDEDAGKPKNWLLCGPEDEAGTPEEQEMFLQEVITFCKENSFEFKPPRFYKQPLNLLKLWREVVKLGGYDAVTACKTWRYVGEAFNPPVTCTTVSYTFRNFYEKALLDYEKYLTKNGELDLPGPPVMLAPKVEVEKNSHRGTASGSGSGSGRVQRGSALKARNTWHTLDLAVNEEDEITLAPRLKKLKSIGMKNNPPVSAGASTQLDAKVVDLGPHVDWVKITVHVTKDSYEVYVLVPGLLREEVRVQTDPAGRLIITGRPEELDNPWGITPFKKVVALPTRIDELGTSAVLTLQGRLFVRVPFAE